MTQLPSFRNPPVVEVALSVQFASLLKLRAAHLGLFWAERRSLFPSFSEGYPILPISERFGRDRFGKAEVNVELLDMPPVPRIMMSNVSNTELIQLQQDRLAHNWKRTRRADVYPRYGYVRTAFMDDLRMLRDFVRKEELGDLMANQCEVTSVNHIEADDNGNFIPLEQVLKSA